MNFSRALTICSRIVDLPGDAGLGMIASALAKRRGITVSTRETMKELILDVASRHADVIPLKRTKQERKQARANMGSQQVVPFAKRAKKPKAGPNNDRFYLCKEWRQLRYLVLKNTDGRCMCCGACAKDGVRIHVDHIKPRSRFPELELDINNLQILCDDCNIGKGAWDMTDWRAFV